MLRFLIVQILIGLALTAPALGLDNQSSSSPSTSMVIENILQDIRELTHPTYQGRQAGTDGGLHSANYLVDRFRSLGLQPVNRFLEQEPHFHWLQQRSMTAVQLLESAMITLSLVNSNQSSMTMSLVPGPDILPVLDSPATRITARVVFVGYGIVDPARGTDEYQGMNVHNRIVLFLRGKPPSYPGWVTHEEKAATAKERGAVGYLTATGPLLDRYEARKGLGQAPLAIYGGTPDNRPIPGAWIHGKLLDQVLKSANDSLEALQQAANNSGEFLSRPLPLLAKFQWESRSLSGTLTNVIGMLPGRDPELRKEIILIGAHRDHFGQQAGLLFPGADDNASGTAVMLELARMLSQSATSPKRTILFVSFDGEERGLLGSNLYVSHPAFPLERTVAMINLDHLGVGNGKLTVGVTRIDKTLAQQAADQTGLREKIQLYGYFPGGDHVPFYDAGVPTVTVVSSGTHPQFHQPSDTLGSIQPENLETGTQFLLSLLVLLADHSQPVSHPEPTAKDLSPG
ncbi:MAG: M20/M25/M40 family metallo-hydrolase [Nitrospirota bacterium]|nr:M20/M25/M40 family metallo-hydrolase [Nitrospirota bacterium]MDH5699286.1 M20/M25/M40 family metallo-hydrolase [Nitrospirota bacterium]